MRPRVGCKTWRNWIEGSKRPVRLDKGARVDLLILEMKNRK
jgi:hypothetical protein